ncbi:hypothetical protein, partial [Salmonella enterica subsp. enterica serovar Rissen]
AQAFFGSFFLFVDFSSLSLHSCAKWRFFDAISPCTTPL